MLLENQENINNIQNQNIFYRAVVENNHDGAMHGKCQVRIHGNHPVNALRTGKNMGVPVAELPWAEIMVSTGFHGGMSGYGISAVPLKGSWVWVFLDGGDWNRPIIVGIISGTSNMERPGSPKVWGFHDPDKVYPIKKRLSEPDQNRLAANRKFAETPIKKIRDASRDKGISTSTGGTWDEMKELTSAAAYPNNTVFETVGHSFVEYDSTGGNERIHFFHATGTYWEMQPKGDYQFKTKRDRFEIVDRDYKRLVKRKQMTTVQDNVETKYDAKETILVGGDHKETIKGKVEQNYKSSLMVKVSSSCKEKYSGGQTTDGGPMIKISAGIIKLN